MRSLQLLVMLVGLACKHQQEVPDSTKILLWEIDQSTKGLSKFAEEHVFIGYAKPHMRFQLQMNGQYQLDIHADTRRGQMPIGYRDTIVSFLLRSKVFEEASGEHHPGYHVVSISDDIGRPPAFVELDARHEVAMKFREVLDEFLKNSSEPLPKGYDGPEINTPR